MNLPNSITLLRFGLVIPLVAAFEFEPIGRQTVPTTWSWIAFTCFLVAMATDWLDGYLARKWHQTSTLGALLDPLADKVLVAAALIGLTHREVVPTWTVVVIVAREFLITGLRVRIAQSDGGVTPSTLAGKVKTAVQVVSIALYLLPGGGLKFAADLAYSLAIGLTVGSGAEYLWKSRSVLR